MASIASRTRSVEYQRTSSPLSTDVKHPSLDPGHPHSKGAAKQNGHYCSHPDCDKVRLQLDASHGWTRGALYNTKLNSVLRFSCLLIKVRWPNTNSRTAKTESTNVPNARKVSNGSIICKSPACHSFSVDTCRSFASQARPYANARRGQASQMSHSELQTNLLRRSFVEATHRKCPPEHSRGHSRRWPRGLPKLPAGHRLRQNERRDDEQ